jgi:hypothetical protein
VDSPIKSGNDEQKKFKCLLAGLVIGHSEKEAQKQEDKNCLWQFKEV